MIADTLATFLNPSLCLLYPPTKFLPTAHIYLLTPLSLSSRIIVFNLFIHGLLAFYLSLSAFTFHVISFLSYIGTPICFRSLVYLLIRSRACLAGAP